MDSTQHISEEKMRGDFGKLKIAMLITFVALMAFYILLNVQFIYTVVVAAGAAVVALLMHLYCIRDMINGDKTVLKKYIAVFLVRNLAFGVILAAIAYSAYDLLIK